MPAVPYVLDPGEGEVVSGAAGTFRVKASGPAFDVATTTLRAGEEPPPHVHEQEDVGVYVLEGTLTILAGGEDLRAAAGSFALVPRGVRHAFRVESSIVRLLLVFAPWGVLSAYGESNGNARR